MSVYQGTQMGWKLQPSGWEDKAMNRTVVATSRHEDRHITVCDDQALCHSHHLYVYPIRCVQKPGCIMWPISLGCQQLLKILVNTRMAETKSATIVVKIDSAKAHNRPRGNCFLPGHVKKNTSIIYPTMVWNLKVRVKEKKTSSRKWQLEREQKHWVVQTNKETSKSQYHRVTPLSSGPVAAILMAFSHVPTVGT